MKETITYTEASHPSVLEQARATVFLADVQEALRKEQRVYDLELHLEVVRGENHYNSSGCWYIIAKNREGEEVTSQNANNMGQHGEHVHPWNGTGEPELVASSLRMARYWFNEKKAQAKKEGKHG